MSDEHPIGATQHHLAISTGQAARYCYVSPDSILNWIHNRSLPAQRTPGGQFRIRVSDLYGFMRHHEMDTRLLESELEMRPTCWEFYGELCVDAAHSICGNCIVQRSATARCWQLADQLPQTPRRARECEACEYFQLYGSDEDGPQPAAEDAEPNRRTRRMKR